MGATAHLALLTGSWAEMPPTQENTLSSVPAKGRAGHGEEGISPGHWGSRPLRPGVQRCP